jgi:T-complex protein 10 C-terminus
MNNSISIFVPIVLLTMLIFSSTLSSRLIYGNPNMPPPVQGPAVDCNQDPSACQNPPPATTDNNPPPATTDNNPPPATTDNNTPLCSDGSTPDPITGCPSDQQQPQPQQCPGISFPDTDGVCVCPDYTAAGRDGDCSTSQQPQQQQQEQPPLGTTDNNPSPSTPDNNPSPLPDNPWTDFPFNCYALHILCGPQPSLPLLYPPTSLAPPSVPDRTITTTAPDGAVTSTTYVAGKLTLTTSTKPDGTKTTILADGRSITDKPDGTVITFYPSDGSTITTKPDGTKTTYYKNGPTITKYPDGRTVIH